LLCCAGCALNPYYVGCISPGLFLVEVPRTKLALFRYLGPGLFSRLFPVPNNFFLNYPHPPDISVGIGSFFLPPLSTAGGNPLFFSPHVTPPPLSFAAFLLSCLLGALPKPTQPLPPPFILPCRFFEAFPRTVRLPPASLSFLFFPPQALHFDRPLFCQVSSLSAVVFPGGLRLYLRTCMAVTLACPFPSLSFYALSWNVTGPLRPLHSRGC